MVERVESLSSGRISDVLSVVLPNGTILAAANLVPVSHAVTITAGMITILYAIWRWRRDSYVICQGCREGHPPTECPLKPSRRPPWCPRNL